MFGKLFLAALALLVLMWWTGFDFAATKGELTSAAQGSARSAVGNDSGGWG
jgi:hypothetical protein